jgi:hypothetical protein
MRSISLLIVLLGLTGCATSQEQGPSGPAENIPSYSAGLAEINEVLTSAELVLREGVPLLVLPPERGPP